MTVTSAAQASASRTIRRIAESTLPTEFGEFRVIVYRSDARDAHPTLSNEHVALIKGHLEGSEDLPLRVHSECLTGEVFSSLKCDCKDQLREAQQYIQSQQRGCILYLRQEGRGIGLANKIRAYALQDAGADTIEANEQLNLPVDARSYDAAAWMLRDLGVRSVRVLTNNPQKLEGLARHGIQVTGRIPVVIHPNPHSTRYLEVKRDRMHHMLPGASPGAAGHLRQLWSGVAAGDSNGSGHPPNGNGRAPNGSGHSVRPGATELFSK